MEAVRPKTRKKKTRVKAAVTPKATPTPTVAPVITPSAAKVDEREKNTTLDTRGGYVGTTQSGDGDRTEAEALAIVADVVHAVVDTAVKTSAMEMEVERRRMNGVKSGVTMDAMEIGTLTMEGAPSVPPHADGDSDQEEAGASVIEAGVDASSNSRDSAPSADDREEGIDGAKKERESGVAAPVLPSAPPVQDDAVLETSATPSAPTETEMMPPLGADATSSAPDVSFASAPSAPPSHAEAEVEAATANSPLVEAPINQHDTKDIAAESAPIEDEKNDQLRGSVQDEAKLTKIAPDSASVLDKTAEKAHAVVRESFVRIRNADVGSRELYPDVQLEAISETAVDTKNESQKLQATNLPVIFIKLEPHSNFEMGLLRASASQKRQETKMRHIETNKGDLYNRLERYLYSEVLLHSAGSNLSTRKQEIESLVEQVWVIETKKLSSVKRCGDETDVEENLEFQTAKLDTHQLAKLRSRLERLRQLRTVEASLHTFDRAMSYFHIEQYLSDVIEEPNLVAFLNKMNAASMAINVRGNGMSDLDTVPSTISFYDPLPNGSALASAIDHLKYCIDVMVFFEKQVTLDDCGLFGRVPSTFCRGEMVWNTNGKSLAGGEKRIRCYACGTLNAQMEVNQSCGPCEGCGVVLYMPPSSISTTTNEWYTSVSRFRQSLQKWICLCLRTVLRLRLLANMPYVLMHIMYLPRVSMEERSWILRFLQFPKAIVDSDGAVKQEWTEELVDHYIAMIHLVFHPEKLRRLSKLVTSDSSPKRREMLSNTNEPGNVSPEWVFLENPEKLNQRYLSDSDFVAVLNQFPNRFAFEQLFRCTRDTKKSFSRALSLITEFTQALRVFQDFELFPQAVAQLLCQLLMEASQMSAATASMTQAGDARIYPTLFDQLFITSLQVMLLPDCNRVAWKCIQDFPFEHLSGLAKWDVLALLLFGIHEVPSEAKNFSAWMSFIAKVPVVNAETPYHARNGLFGLIESDTDGAVHLLNAAARLASSCPSKDLNDSSDHLNELVTVATHELFLAGFAHETCRLALGDSGERAAGPISVICMKHPWIISELISLLFKYHQCAETWIQVFETFPVNRWMPTTNDLMNIQEWLLLSDCFSSRSALARFLLDHINWDFDLNSGSLYTNPYLHRQVALVIAEALMAYHMRQQQGEGLINNSTDVPAPRPTLRVITMSIRRALRLEKTVDFEAWCWRLMLKLKFYSPLTHDPLVDLIELRRDRSREALLLRRWFPNSATPSSAVNVGIPFYESQEDRVRIIEDARRRGMSDDQGFKAMLYGGGSAETPICEDSNGAPTASSHTGEDLEATVAAVPSGTTEPIAAYLVCQVTTFLFSDRMDRWEPLLLLMKNNFFSACAKVLDNVVPLMAKLDEVQLEASAAANGVEPLSCEISGSGYLPNVDHTLSVCMATIEGLSTDQMLQLVQSLHLYSYISYEECQLLSDLLNKGYIGGWESMARAKVLPYLRFVRECSRFLHPLVLPTMINEWFPSAGSTSLSGGALFQGALSWLTSLYSGNEDLPSLSDADAILSGLALQRSSLVPVVPTAPPTAVTAAAAAAASLGMLDAHGDHSSTTVAIASMIQDAFRCSSPIVPCGFATYWLRTILQVPLWFGHPALRYLVDVLFRCSFEQMRDHDWQNRELNQSSEDSILFVLQRILQVAFDQYCEHSHHMANHADVNTNFELPPVMSFLPIDKSGSIISSIFGSAFDAAQYIGNCPMLSFWQLLVEVRQERPLFIAMGSLMNKYEAKAMTKLEKMTQTEGTIATELQEVDFEVTNSKSCVIYAHTSFDSLAQYKVYRWCEFCLSMEDDDRFQILYWQVLFAIIFASDGGNHMFGYRFLEREDGRQSKGVGMRKSLRDKLRGLSTYWSNQAQSALSMGTTGVNTEQKEEMYRHHVQLSHIFVAMDTWLEEPDPNAWLNEEELNGLPRHYEVARLKQVLILSGKLINTANPDFRWNDLPLWTDLCKLEFSQTFLASTSKESGSDNIVSELPEDDFAMIDSAGMDMNGNYCSANPLTLTPEFAGPIALTVLPHVTISYGDNECVITPSISLNQVALKTVTTKFSENLSTLVGLDAEIIDDVSRLYTSKMRVITENKACTEGSNCRQPAVFRFEFTEWTANNQLLDAIHSLLGQCERYDMKSMLMPQAQATVEAHYRFDQTSLSELVQDGVDMFLQLDPDGLMLSFQILLIDQVVETLDAEVTNVKRRIRAESVAETHTKDEASTIADTHEKQLNHLHERGLDWFRTLTDMDTKLSRMLPPFREVLWRSIKQLGISFVCADERETAKLLELMLDDPSRIALLSECFTPAAAPTRFVHMFSKLMSASSSSKLSIEDKLTLLLRFDFSTWLQSKPPHTPTKQDRDTVLNIVLGDITAQFSLEQPISSGKRLQNVTANTFEEVRRVYATVVHLICSSHLGDHLENVLRALVGVHDDYRFLGNVETRNVFDEKNDAGDESGLHPRPAVPAIWDAVVSVPVSTWKQVPYVQAEECVSFLSGHISTLRWQAAVANNDINPFSGSMKKYPLILWQRAGVIKSFLDLFAILVRFAPETQQWSLISSFFEPLLITLYQPASTTEESCISAPWSESDAASIGTALCSCFVAVCSEHLKAKPESIDTVPNGQGHDTHVRCIQQKLDNVWGFYRDHLIVHAPVYVCKIFHQFLTRLSWEKWFLTVESIREMRKMIEDEKQQLTTRTEGISASYPFVSWMVRDILCRLTWKNTETWMASQSEATQSLFLSELGKVSVELVLDHSHYQPHDQRMKTQPRSSNALPPYFVNYVKQQPTFWSKWVINTSDMLGLLEFAINAVTEPLHDTSREGSTSIFPQNPSLMVLQDAFTRIQLVLRLLSQIMTLTHPILARSESLSRVNAFIRMLTKVFESVGNGNENGLSAHTSWQVVMTGAACTVLFEKLDEFVQVCHPGTVRQDEEGINDEDMVNALIEVLRLLNLPNVEKVFRHQSVETSNAVSWNKCGNVTFVEVDGLIRDFAATSKAKASVSSDWDLADLSGDEENPVTVGMGATLSRLLWSFLGFQGGELCCLEATGRAIASVHVMSRVTEQNVEKWIIEERRGSWDDLVMRLKVPELGEEEFEATCLNQGNLMTLQVLFLQQIRKAPAVTEALATGMLSKLIMWMDRALTIGTTTPLTEMKIVFLAAETTNFVCRTLENVLPSQHKKQMLRELCNILLRFGNARRQHGIMKAIGIGGSLRYNIEFHVCTMTIGIFLRLQTRNSVPLRTDERIPYHVTQTTQKHIKSLEQMLTSKNTLQLQKRMEWMLEFLQNPARSLADQDEFFVIVAVSQSQPAVGDSTDSRDDCEQRVTRRILKRSFETSNSITRFKMARSSVLFFFALLCAVTSVISFQSVVQAADAPSARASHILVESEAECDKLAAQLKQTDDVSTLFAQLAKDHSKCPSSRHGGDLGQFGRGAMVREFDAVVFEQPKGIVHKVHTQFGWHLVLVVERSGVDEAAILADMEESDKEAMGLNGDEL